MVNKAIATLAVALAVSGCAKNESRDWLGGAGTLRLTRSVAPAETYEIQEARAKRVFARSDSLLYSAWFVESNHPEYPFSYVVPVCSGPVCTVTNQNTGQADTFDKFDLSDEFGDRRPILTRNGITTIEAFNERLADYGGIPTSARTDPGCPTAPSRSRPSSSPSSSRTASTSWGMSGPRWPAGS